MSQPPGALHDDLLYHSFNVEAIQEAMPREIDWDAIAKRLPKVEDTRIQTAKLADMDYWMLKAAAKAKKEL